MISNPENLPELNPDDEARELLLEDAGDTCVAAQPEFRVTDDGSADWVLNMMASWKAEQERVQAAAAERVKRLQKKIDWFERRFRLDLEDYARAKLAGSKTKTLRMPCGVKVNFKKVNRSLKVDKAREQDLLAYAKEHLPPHAVKVEESVVKSAVNEWWEKTGDVPPGCFVQPEEERFYIGI